MPFIGNQPARIPLTSADITDGIIVNADVSSTAGITLNKISGNTGFKNVIINGGFIINQRGYTSGTALASGSYGHDRWKGGASGGTYTFTAGSTGVNTTLTITAGSIIQVIEGANLPVSGTYVLSWTGTAQGKIGSGSFSSSGVTGTITAGTNTNIEFNTGTCGNVQLELGSVASSFDYRNFGTELLLCQRYFEKTFPINVTPANNTGSSAEVFFSSPANGGGFGLNLYFSYMFKVTKRAAATVTSFNTRDTVSNTWSTFAAQVRANNTPIFESITDHNLIGYIQRADATLAIGAMTISSEL
jgi:hypothetical protein